MSTTDLLTRLEIYCPNATCGDPVPSSSGQTLYTKRRMSYYGETGLGTAKYVCPVCGNKRFFRLVGSEVEETKETSSDCFVATVVYQSPNASEVLRLRQFRDEKLATSKFGRLFITGYYLWIGPVMAKVVMRIGTPLRRIVKFVLDLAIRWVRVLLL